MVTIGLESLQSQLGTGTIVGGEALSATEIRRLACNADIIPVVLGGKGEILDLGRSRRLFSPAQRKAMMPAPPALSGRGLHRPGPMVRSGLPRILTDTVTVVVRTTERCRDGDLLAGVQGPDRRAAPQGRSFMDLAKEFNLAPTSISNWVQGGRQA